MIYLQNIKDLINYITNFLPFDRVIVQIIPSIGGFSLMVTIINQGTKPFTITEVLEVETRALNLVTDENDNNALDSFLERILKRCVGE